MLKYIIAFQNKHWNLCSCNIMNKVVQHIHYVSISNVFIIHFEWKPFHLATNLPCKTDLSPFCGDVKPLSIRLTAQRSNFHTRILPLINKSHKKAWKQSKKKKYLFVRSSATYVECFLSSLLTLVCQTSKISAAFNQVLNW